MSGAHLAPQQHGLQDVSVDEHGTTTRKVALACTKPQENAAYTQIESHFIVLDTIKNLDPPIPMHWILGARVDLVYAWFRLFSACGTLADRSLDSLCLDRNIATRP